MRDYPSISWRLTCFFGIFRERLSPPFTIQNCFHILPSDTVFAGSWEGKFLSSDAPRHVYRAPTSSFLLHNLFHHLNQPLPLLSEPTPPSQQRSHLSVFVCPRLRCQQLLRQDFTTYEGSANSYPPPIHIPHLFHREGSGHLIDGTNHTDAQHTALGRTLFL